MSGAGEQDGGDDKAVLAGEYVLGLLTPEAARALERAAETDAVLAAAIAAWRDRMDPLTAVPPPLAPSDLLWARIERDLPLALAVSPPPAPAFAAHLAEPAAPRGARAWRAVALASMAAAAALAAILVWPQARQVEGPAPWARAVALLSAPGEARAELRAQVTAAGTITVVPLHAITVAPGEKLGFWAWPADQPKPVLLGMIPPAGGQLVFPFQAQDGTPVMVTREPATGPGATPGPTLYLGLLARTT